jgi:hypothetical protein
MDDGNDSDKCNLMVYRNLIVKVDVGNVIDVGSGMGHLSRYLCYAHNIQVPRSYQLPSTIVPE